MNYTFHQLQIFLKVCELRSVTKASEAMYLTQPAVSIQLKKFQEQFDIPLTELVGRKVFVTDFGKEIAKVSEKIIKQSELIKTTALQYQGLLAGKIGISVVSTGKYVMPYFMSGFVKDHREVEVSIDVTNKAQVLESLNSNEVDFALVSVLPDDTLYEKVELLPNDLYLVSGVDDTRDTVDSNDVSEMPMIFREEGSATRKMMEQYFNSNGIQPASTLELVSNEAVKQAVCAGLGYSIMPLIGMKHELEAGELKIVQAKGLPVTTHWNLIYMKGKSLSPAAQALLEYVLEYRDEIVAQKFSDLSKK